jgi:predicted MFS family arabinose efflux permease
MSKESWFIILLSRMLINLNLRVTYPFLPVIARGLGIPFEQAGFLVAVRHCVGLTGFLFGFLSVRKGYFWGMQMGLAMLFVGALTVSYSTHFLMALVGFIFLGFAKTAYDPNIQAFVSARTPYPVRARAFGILELSWAGSWLLGIPLSGFLIAYFGWQSPFVFLSAGALVALLLMRRLEKKHDNNPNHRKRADTNDCVPTKPELPLFRCVAVLGTSLFMIFANENLVIVYGAWIEEAFHLQPQALGLFSILMGLSELAGEFTVFALVDRVGKRRAIMSGLLLTGLSYVILPYCQHSMILALLGLTFMFYVFEFTVVSTFPYISELVPSKRGQWLAFNFTLLIMGRLGGALTGPWLWQKSHDLHLLAVVSLFAQFLAFILLFWAGRKKR